MPLYVNDGRTPLQAAPSSRQELLAPRGFGYGELLSIIGSSSGSAPALSALAVQGIGSLSTGVSSITPTVSAAGSGGGGGLGNETTWALSGGGIASVTSALQMLDAPFRLAAQVALPAGTPAGGDEFFVGVTIPPTSPTATLLLGGGPGPSVGVGWNSGIGPDWQVQAGGGAAVPTGVPAAGGPIVIIELVENPATTWTVAIYDAVSLLPLFPPTPFPGVPVGPYGFTLYFNAASGGSVSSIIWGVSIGPQL